MNANRRSPDPQEPLPLTPLQRELLAVMRADAERSWTNAEVVRAVIGSGVMPVSTRQMILEFHELHDKRGLIVLADDSPRQCAETGGIATTYKAAST